MPQPDLHAALPYLIGIVVLVVLMSFRLRRMSQMRPLKVEWLWVTPAILIAVTVAALIRNRPRASTGPISLRAWCWAGRSAGGGAR